MPAICFPCGCAGRSDRRERKATPKACSTGRGSGQSGAWGGAPTSERRYQNDIAAHCLHRLNEPAGTGVDKSNRILYTAILSFVGSEIYYPHSQNIEQGFVQSNYPTLPQRVMCWGFLYFAMQDNSLFIYVVIPFNQPCEKEIPPGSDAPAGQGQSRGGRSGRKTRPDRIGGISWAGHDRYPG